MAAATLAQKIARSLPKVKAGTLRFWGVWFGRPYDNVHRIVGVEATSEVLTLHFDGGETLEVWLPEHGRVSSKEFSITNAARVRWQWFHYGMPAIPANAHFMDFVRTRETIAVSTDSEPLLLTTELNLSAPAVEMF